MARDIAELLLAHDERALGEADRRYGTYLRFLSESITHDARDAEECVNDAFLALWRAENVTSPAAFLTETVRRLSYKRVRSEKTQKRSGETRMLTSERACEIPDRREPWDEIEVGELRGALSEFLTRSRRKTGSYSCAVTFIRTRIPRSAVCWASVKTSFRSGSCG